MQSGALVVPASRVATNGEAPVRFIKWKMPLSGAIQAVPEALVSPYLSRIRRARFLSLPLLLVHSFVRLRQEFAKRNRVLGIELRHANAEG